MSHRYISTRMAKIKETKTQNVERMESHWVRHTLLERVKNVGTTVANFLKVSYKAKYTPTSWIQLFHSEIFTQKKIKLCVQIFVHRCSLQLYS